MKKIIAMIMAVVIAISISCVCAFADGNATVKVTDANVKAGDSFSVKVSLENCDEITSLSVKLNYDNSVLKLVDGKCLVGNAILYQVDTKNNVALFKFDGNVNANGDIFELNFSVDSNAQSDSYKISIDRIVIKQLTNEKEIDLSANTKAGVVTIKSDEKPTNPPASTEPPVTVPPASTDPSTEPPVTVPPVSTDPSTKPPVTDKPEPTETTTATTTTTEPSTKDRIPQTGDSSAIALVAGVCVIAGVAFVATRKKDSE